MATNPRIGRVTNDGAVIHPEQTIAGRPIVERPTQLHMLGNGTFCVIDIFLPPDFDLEGALAALRPAKATPGKRESVEVKAD